MLIFFLKKMELKVKIILKKDGVKGENNTLMPFCIDNDKLLQKYKTI